MGTLKKKLKLSLLSEKEMDIPDSLSKLKYLSIIFNKIDLKINK
jgi:hypothetical protein